MASYSIVSVEERTFLFFFNGKPTRFYVRHLSLYTERRDEAFFVLLGLDCFFLLVLFFVLFSASYVC